MRLLTSFKYLCSLVFILLLASCGDSSDSPFPKPNCGSTDNPCKELVTFTISPSNKTILVGLTQQFNATAYYSDNSIADVTEQVEWQLDNTTVAEISKDEDNKGLVTGTAVGSVFISAKLINLSAVAQIQVIDEIAEQLTIVSNQTEFPESTSGQFSAYLLLANNQHVEVTEQVNWQMTDESIAEIDSDAFVTAKSQGNTELNASIEHNNIELTTAAQVIVTNNIIDKIVINPTNKKMAVGTTVNYKALAFYTDGQVFDVSNDASWEIADNTIVEIAQSTEYLGNTTALTVGITEISATFKYSSSTTNIEVSTATLQSITVSPVNTVVAAGSSTSYQAHALYSDNSTQNITHLAAWSSSIPEVANIQFTGTLSGVAKTFTPGITQITAHYLGMNKAVSLTVTENLN